MSEMAAESYGVRELLEAWNGALHTVVELGRRLSPEQWAAETECPGWSAGDIVRHLAWIESFMSGRPQPEHEMDWSRFPHITNDFGRLTEIGVDVRRGQQQQECCDELADLADVRLGQIMALDPLTLETEVMGVFGTPVPLDRMVRMRCFDTWTHEQDIRRAVQLPANMRTMGAHVAALQMARTLGFMLAKNVQAPPGTTMRLTVTGPIEFERYAAVTADGKGTDVEPLEHPTIGLTTDWETYARLTTGRLDTTDPAVLAKVELAGDPDLAARIPAALAITP
jgi:uncharacterized protein (TIGR03083 family)